MRLVNQHKIIPIKKLVGVPINIDQVCNIADFEVIETVDNIHSYPSLLGLDWAFHNQVIINLKKREMIFEGGGLKVSKPLDPTEARRYVDPTRREIDNVYNMTMCMVDYINPTTDGVLIWRRIISCASESDLRELNIGSTGYTKYRIDDVVASLTLCIGSKQRYMIC
jgi:hypothetical protein